MQAYQNFSYQQPNPFQANYNPMLSPQQRLMQMEQQYPQYSQQNQFMQQPIQQQQFLGLNGKIVEDFNTITGNDVPMDGVGAIFFKNDGSEIQHRMWNATNGSIITTSYKPVQLENTAEATNIPQMDFNALNEDMRALREDIKDVREMIEKSMNIPVQKQTSSRVKKGADEE